MAKQFTLDIRQGYSICRHASFLARNAGERHLEIQALIYGKVILSSVGDFTAAQETSHQIDALLATWIYPELQVLQLLSTAQLKMFRGEVEEAAALVNMVMEEAAQHGLTFMYPLIQLHRFMSLGYLGKYAEAVETGRNLLNLPFSPASVLQGIVSLHLAIFFYHMGDLAGAGEFVARIHKILAGGDFRAEYHLHCLQVVDGLISYNLEELDPATERKLEKTLAEVTGISSYFFMVDAHWALALWRWRQGRLEEAAAHIQAGMEVAAQRGSYYSITLSPRNQGRIFTLALELEVEEVWDSLPPLLCRWSDWVGPDLDRLSQHANPKVAARAWEIRRAIRRQHLPRLHIQTLGRFRLLRPQGPRDEAVWEGKQPKLLLKALVARGGEAPKDVLLEDLWPEGSPDIMEKNFRVTLHRLRKALEPNLDKVFESFYLHSEAGLLSLDRELCRVDVTEFLALFESGRQEEEQGNLNQAMAQYKKAIALYGGDFLPEELYLPGAEKKRAALRGDYLELLERVSQLYEKQGTLGRAIEYCKKPIQADPGLEPAYRRLMTLYACRGMRAEALRTYEACRKALARELDAAPDEVTTAIYRKIQESN